MYIANMLAGNPAAQLHGPDAAGVTNAAMRAQLLAILRTPPAALDTSPTGLDGFRESFRSSLDSVASREFSNLWCVLDELCRAAPELFQFSVTYEDVSSKCSEGCTARPGRPRGNRTFLSIPDVLVDCCKPGQANGFLPGSALAVRHTDEVLKPSELCVEDILSLAHSRLTGPTPNEWTQVCRSHCGCSPASRAGAPHHSLLDVVPVKRIVSYPPVMVFPLDTTARNQQSPGAAQWLQVVSSIFVRRLGDIFGFGATASSGASAPVLYQLIGLGVTREAHYSTVMSNGVECLIYDSIEESFNTKLCSTEAGRKYCNGKRAVSAIFVRVSAGQDLAAATRTPECAVPILPVWIRQGAAALEAPAPAGMPNLDNTCFRNAALQALLSLPLVHSFLVEGSAFETPTKEPHTPVHMELQNLAKALAGDRSAATSRQVRGILEALKTKSEFPAHLRGRGVQQDASEWSLKLWDILLQRFPLLKSLIGCHEVSEVSRTCPRCRRTTCRPTAVHRPHALDLSACGEAPPASAGTGDAAVLHLQELLSAELLSSSALEPADFRCFSCGFGGKVGGQKQVQLALPAPYLALSLKWVVNHGDPVVEAECHIPTHLDVPVAGGGLLPYSLRSVVVHKGSDGHSGHYVAYVRRGACWYLCNDSQVSEVPDIARALSFQTSGPQASQPYMVFFEQVPSSAASKSARGAPVAAADEWTTAAGRHARRLGRHPDARPATPTDDNPFKDLSEDVAPEPSSTIVVAEESTTKKSKRHNKDRAGKRSKGKKKGKKNKKGKNATKDLFELIRGETGLPPFVRQLVKRPYFLPLSPQSVVDPEGMKEQMVAKIEKQMDENGGELLTKRNPRSHPRIENKLAEINREHLFDPRNGLRFLRYIAQQMSTNYGPAATRCVSDGAKNSKKKKKQKAKKDKKEPGDGKKGKQEKEKEQLHYENRMVQMVCVIRIVLNWLMDDETGFGGYFQVRLVHLVG